MQSTEFAYKKDGAGLDLTAVVSWGPDEFKKPIALILHGGGLVLGAGSEIPDPELSYLTETLGFIAVAPNYRLASPNLPASKSALPDTFAAYEWCQTALPKLISERSVTADPSRLVAMGHSTGGTLALSLASARPPPRAICAFYPSLYISDPDTPARKPAPQFDSLATFQPTEENTKEILEPLADGRQLSSYPIGTPGSPLGIRTQWHFTNIANGTWLDAIEPSGDVRAIDPCTRFRELGPKHPPVMIIHGDADNVPASGPAQVNRCVKELRKIGVDIDVVTVQGAGHLFDLQLQAGDENWDYVERGLCFLRKRA